MNLRERGTAINIHLTETWWRHYQVGTTSLKEAKEIAKFVPYIEVLFHIFSYEWAKRTSLCGISSLYRVSSISVRIPNA